MEPDTETVRRNVASALGEDLGPGDINAELIAPSTRAVARIVTRDPGVLCGQPWVAEACRQVDPSLELRWHASDGQRLAEGDLLAELTGAARGLLSVERTAINFLQLLSGTATRTRAFVDAVAATRAVILDTRKTLPGLRAAQKYAVRVGGAKNHRMGLFDAFLLKENHITAAGSIAAAVATARRHHPDKLLQVEVENVTQLEESIAAAVDRILLDNFNVARLREAVAVADGRVPLEASGGITMATVAQIAATGVDFISVGELTKNVEPLDLSMRIVAVERD
ncbi:MAG: carboxylating nicotinate-nucleotide diphosphorylase [Gammaproteobacteria bacterium]|nr:carboxylating nicotinate-nucleotide diphosphorylase [Gammaproteobacteria bacterium]